MNPRLLPLPLLVIAGGVFWWSRKEEPPQDGGLRPSGPVGQAELRAPEPEPASPVAETVEAHTALTAAAPASAGTEARGWNESAIEHLEAQRFEQAVELFRRCTAAEPGEAVFVHNLAESLVRWSLADYDQHPAAALARLEEAIALMPDRQDLVDLAAHWRTAVQEQTADYYEDQSLHFVIRYDGIAAIC
ncbi:MAG: hypothetical protein R3F17_11560 [Planctomycetota bacterium]